MHNPANQAKELVQAAVDLFEAGKKAEAEGKLKAAFALRSNVEGYTGPDWYQAHHTFTEAMLDMADLWRKLGNEEEASALASRAQAWADDPNAGGNQRLFERSLKLQKELAPA